MDTKEKLQTAALDLFSERGFRETTIGAIEANAGLTPRAGTFYRHYSSKQAVFDECLESFVDILGDEFDLQSVMLHNDTRAELIFIAQTMIRLAEQYRKFRKLIRQNSGQKAELLDKLNQTNDWFFNRNLVRWLSGNLAATERKDAPATMAALIFGPILYYLLQRDINAFSYGVEENEFLTSWADHWAGILAVKST